MIGDQTFGVPVVYLWVKQDARVGLELRCQYRDPRKSLCLRRLCSRFGILGLPACRDPSAETRGCRDTRKLVPSPDSKA